MSKLTDWEKGQDLIAISDYIVEKMSEIEDEDIIKKLQECRAMLGDNLDKLKSHEFGIYNSECFVKTYGCQQTNKKYCECGGIIFADTEDWAEPVCYECYAKI